MSDYTHDICPILHSEFKVLVINELKDGEIERECSSQLI